MSAAAQRKCCSSPVSPWLPWFCWLRASDAFQKVWDILTGHQLAAQGKPVAASTPKLSEHVREWIESQPPQVQAEELLSDAINHDEGATDVIMQKLDSWYGRIKLTPKLTDIEMTALYSNDLRVRAAAIEVTLVANELQTTPDTASRLIQMGEETASNRPYAAWYLGMLANRGVDTDDIHDRLVAWSHDPDEQTRFWAVEGLAHIGTDNTIATFLDVFRSDPSDNVRERAGCSLREIGHADPRPAHASRLRPDRPLRRRIPRRLHPWLGVSGLARNHRREPAQRHHAMAPLVYPARLRTPRSVPEGRPAVRPRQ